ncbi:hypothetical protein MPER_09139, partial [Moniliophthora perniciosa FA553]
LKCLLVQETETPYNFGDKEYLAFERVTMCPVQTKLVDYSTAKRRGDPMAE